MADSTKILVIDDNPEDRLLAIRELRQEFPEANIEEVGTADQLHDHLNARDFQLVVTDYQIRWTDGFAVLHEVKKRCPDVPVIMFTATGDQETAVRAMKEGVSDYVVKSAKHRLRLRISARAALDHYRQRKVLRENEKLAVIGRLMATIAHEINNPLDAVSNLLYLAEQRPDKAKEYLATARDEIANVAQITSRTLGFYRESPNPIRFSVTDLVDDILLLYRRRLEFQNIAVRKEYEAAEVISFPGEMRQVLSNLVANALDAVGQNGRIMIRVRPSRGWVDGQQQGVRVTVSDSGPGIAHENRARMFEPFFTTKGVKGTGLGLWVSKGIVQQRGGTMRFRSSTTRERSGTCFSVFFPNEA
jgi:signal transduction histidine kinase